MAAVPLGRLSISGVRQHVVGVSTLAAALSVAQALTRPAPVPLWGRFEAAVTNGRSYANPFADVGLNTTFTRPDAQDWALHLCAAEWAAWAAAPASRSRDAASAVAQSLSEIAVGSRL